MKISKICIVTMFLTVLLIASLKSEEPKTIEEAKTEANRLLNEYYHYFDERKFDEGLICIDKVLDLCARYSFKKETVIQIMDKKHFTLMKMGRFADSLKISLQLEEMAKEIGQADNPWYCLKIADSYIGMKNTGEAVEWIGKAVYERNFKNYKIFSNSNYDTLRTNADFQKMILYMKDKIGLNHPAKEFTITAVDGAKLSLSSFKGKVVLIDFWDVLCTPCVRAIPELKELYKTYHEQGLEIIGISLDTDEDLLKNFLNERSIPWKVACSYKGYEDYTVKLYGINATPSTWLIDRNGVLRYNEVKGEELKKAVETLLKERE